MATYNPNLCPTCGSPRIADEWVEKQPDPHPTRAELLGENEMMRSALSGVADVYPEVAEMCAKHGLVLTPSKETERREDNRRTDAGEGDGEGKEAGGE